MTKFLLTGVAALALMTGVAHAQNVITETTTKSVTTPSAIAPTPITPDASIGGAFNSSKSKKVIHSDGTVTEKSDTYSAGSTGTKSTSTVHATTPNGSEVVKHDERVTSPIDGSTTTSSTTATKVNP